LNHSKIWSSVCDYYYDHIHWDTDAKNSNISIREWLRRDFQVDYCMPIQQFMFPNEEVKTWFLLRWQ